MTIDFINESGLEFTDISSEKIRTYVFEGMDLAIYEPLWLHVSDSGGHRVFSASGESHYIAPKWLAIIWEVHDGEPNFIK